MKGPENPSFAKEYAGKGLKYSGFVIGFLGLLGLNFFVIAAGTGAALYGRHIEQKNQKH